MDRSQLRRGRISFMVVSRWIVRRVFSWDLSYGVGYRVQGKLNSVGPEGSFIIHESSVKEGYLLSSGVTGCLYTSYSPQVVHSTRLGGLLIQDGTNTTLDQ